ncbi:mannose-1-phosphate guanylyltransferase/mannose-6-phosphate isomerase [Tamilnaduibacter salinus]|uniref:Alginate biosynthesis protein AlgA n=1 Tax=Tamilnaduibacter salinus TaxID=1484056 RepID=A0A2U1CV43_9GAMM|nr:mannose-1-phosphate guanylyltransferase/mannose-6-phosphate isomerase [Tamilnaduibacter salinus]PVY70841.1 mannose-1-phosphate guanylyltransferase/mannose-6-phosphate isomerase [Tamilnaduibacter salinus]
MIAVILAGGSGTRLWPMSRETFPKQFLPLTGGQSLLEETVARSQRLDPKPSVLAVTSEAHRFLVAEHLNQQMPTTSWSVLLEPESRNTAPAVALAALDASARSPSELLLVLPSDHAMSDSQAFLKAVGEGDELARAGKMVTFGVTPRSAETGYGYIRAGVQEGAGARVDAFVEKPDAETAARYRDSGEYYWNSGMFLFRADRYLEELGKWRPDILAACRQAWEARSADLDFIRVEHQAFDTCPADSIDCAIMEHTGEAVVVPLDAGWSDVGSWEALWDLQEKDANGNVCRGDVITESVTGSYIHSDGRLVAALGVEDHVIVETDDVVLVADRARVQSIKGLVARLRADGREEHRQHRHVHRPWGYYDQIASGERFQVKRITVHPGGSLSLQKHHHRAEHWVIVSGIATVEREGESFRLDVDQSIDIPQGQMHRLSNQETTPLELIEVQTGSYLGEDDIVRFEDAYDRE